MLSKQNIENIYPLSPLQEGIYFHTQLDKSAISYFQQLCYRFEGNLNPDFVRRSFQKIIERHDILRTIFIAKDTNRILQVVLRKKEADYSYITLPERDKEKDFIREYKLKEKNKGFNLGKDNLIRLSLIKIDNNLFEFIWSFHHIILDGWCMGLLNKEFIQIYNILANNLKYNLPKVPQYRTYIQWLEKQDKNKSLAYWNDFLSGYYGGNRVPGRINRKNINGYNIEKFSFTIKQDKLMLLEKICTTNNLTMNSVMQALWAIIVGKYNHTNDIVFGAVVSGRPEGLLNVENILGLFINTVPVRVELDDQSTLLELIKSVQQSFINSRPHHHSSLASIQAKSDLKSELIDHIFVYENYPLQDSLNFSLTNIEQGIPSRISDIEIFEQTNYDFNLVVSVKEEIKISFLFNSNVFDIAILQNVAEHFNVLVDELINDPTTLISEISLLSEVSEKVLFNLMTVNEIKQRNEKSIIELFYECVEMYPGKIALKFYDQELTYSQLAVKIEELAGLLNKNKISEGDIVAIHTDRSFEMIISILACLSIGAIYLPIDPNIPSERRKLMIDDAQVSAILTHELYLALFNGLENVLKINVSETRNSERFLGRKSNTGAPAYIMYTSGSTGKPKGILISEKSIIRIVKETNYIKINNNDRILQLSNYSFDGSTFDIFGALLNGATLVLVGEDIMKSIEELTGLIEKEEISVFFITTALFNAIIDYNVLCLKNVRKILFGGERVSFLHVKKVLDAIGKDKLVHVYGPTETTVFAAYYFINSVDEKLETIPIGKPIMFTANYILDHTLKLQPYGAIGEIFIGGEGVSFGYINNQELTSEKYIKSTFFKNKPLYRTGDIGRLLPDGNIEFIGRKDGQFKLRGFRIELGEIENSIKQIVDVKEAVILLKEDNNVKKICAFLQVDKNLSIQEIKTFLNQRLPEYMMPNQYYILDEFPLTKNHKVDQNALLKLNSEEKEKKETLDEPQNDIEKLLVEIWKNVLGVDQIGVNESFFSKGGDSIKTIQIIAKLNASGYKVNMKDIFRYPTIHELSVVVKKNDNPRLESEIAEGEIPLSPIQKYFFTNYLTDVSHFNQSVVLASRDRVDTNMLFGIFNKLVEHHDSLRISFMTKADKQITQIYNQNIDFRIQYVDMSNDKRVMERMEEIMNEEHATIDPLVPPLFRIVLFHLKKGDYLFIAIHHLIIDTISWRILLQDLNDLYNRSKDEKPLELISKTDTYGQWSKSLTSLVKSANIKQQKTYWNSISKDVTIPADYSQYEKENTYGLAESLTFELSENDTEVLLTKVHSAYYTETRDILVHCLYQALTKVFELSDLLLLCESHGRDELGDFNISRTIGWFTALYPIYLKIDTKDIGENLKIIKEILRAIPDNGIGYGIIKYCIPENGKEFKLNSCKPEISFNYLGSFDSVKSNDNFVISDMSAGQAVRSDYSRDVKISFTIYTIFGKTHINITYGSKLFNKHTIESVRDEYLEALHRTINLCTAKTITEPTPSDFTYKKLTIEQVNKLSADHRLFDIYPLSPMQEGMFFHHLYEKDSLSYFEQAVFELEGNINEEVFFSSLELLYDRYDVLRTFFKNEGFTRPLQIVLKTKKTCFKTIDISDKNNDSVQCFIDDYRQQERELRFSLQDGELMRITLFKGSNNKYYILWSYHHIIMDGWCLSLVITDFLKIYKSGLKNKPALLPPTVPYKNYILWLEEQDQLKAKQYWREYLKNYSQLASIEKNLINVVKQGYSEGYYNQSCSEELSVKLKQLASQYNYTLNSIVQTAWGILLSKLSNTDDVVFGSVVSGRPSEIIGIESIVGLFINTVPIRIESGKKISFKDLINKVQNDALESESYHFYSLADIQADSDLKRNLFDHILVFENYPIAEEIKRLSKSDQTSKLGFKITNVEVTGLTNYNLVVLFNINKKLNIYFKYNNNVYPDYIIENISKYLIRILESIVEDINNFPQEIKLLTKNEELKQIKRFHPSKNCLTNCKTIVDYFENQVTLHKDRLAVKYYEHEYSYLEFNQKSNQLARFIIHLGVRPGSIIAVYSPPNHEMLMAIMGILKAGCVFLPIDTQLPAGRINYLIEDSSATLLFMYTDEKEIGSRSRKVNLTDALNAEPETGNLGLEIDSNVPVYSIYTSGTTGKAKGVIITNNNLLNYIHWAINEIQLDEKDKVILTSSFSFDALYTCAFGSLLSGGELHITERDDYLIPESLLYYIKSHNITYIKVTPSLFNLIVENSQFTYDNIKSLRFLMLGGEAINTKDVEKMLMIHPQINIMNHYGPTETTIGSIRYSITPQNFNKFKTLPVIGSPIYNTEVLILDNCGRLVSPGFRGELCIGGNGVGLGYLNAVEKTHDKFIQNPYNKESKLYKTGDQAGLLPNGEVCYLGRKDHQVKLHGYRIELDEIRERMLRINSIREVVVCVKNSSNNDKYLCAFYTVTSKISIEKIKAELSNFLPEYMIPAYFIQLESIPLTQHNKIDYEQLDISIEDNFVESNANSFTEDKLLELCAEVLGKEMDNVGINQNFFDIGGHSLKAIRLISSIHEHFSVKVPLEEVFSVTNLRELATFISSARNEQFYSIKKAIPKKYYNLSSAQKRIFFIQTVNKDLTSYNMPYLSFFSDLL